ncbi:universal stress protein [Mesorhizobium sp.]|uniref:universal stress protein n=1 Tax=Mesorhizobium sp. TaxID=1871066 RepID=UPI000FE793CB|nr:universal stress protein [Mesorhizobium sp.]RWK65671.1 MAG: universal stress protein [Mesorhizobium sp.]RWM53891.1 MAG: universal stress protein [Mesorhizobium sp.]RWM60741.1 MAG: universal stress protein [Mesorhizobium sp.]RWM62065.1 MAG: universal stress protein [Mesorhizobium sp.]RWN03711.1 MAG: universal stress protein [Mesorhizobium sp.]
MTFRTLLTITGPNQGEGDLKLAASLCEQIDAHLSVLVLELAAPPSGGEYAVVLSPAWLEERQADLKRLKKRVSEVAAFVSQTAVSVDLSDDYPDTTWADEIIGRRARYADLAILGPDLLASHILKDKVIEGVLFSSGRPLLLVPEGSRPTLKPKRVLVAWDARLESSRALRESLDLLIGAEDVHIAIIDPVEDEYHHGAEPGADAAAFLARHGVKVTVDRLPSSNHSVADVLRRHAVDTAADLMVMGAYGHSRLRERIFGGVTKSMLENPSLPIMMAR